jgi:hypothetical protein
MLLDGERRDFCKNYSGYLWDLGNYHLNRHYNDSSIRSLMANLSAVLLFLRVSFLQEDALDPQARASTPMMTRISSRAPQQS